MIMLPLASLSGVLLGWLMAFLSLFLIMLILIQRGKGGGLTGALGGPGGQSAFGSKAGDTFTAITIVVASLWGLTCVITMLVLGDGGGSASVSQPETVQAAPADDTSEGLVVTPTDSEESGDESGVAEATESDSQDSDASATPSADIPANSEDISGEGETEQAAPADDQPEQETQETAAE